MQNSSTLQSEFEPHATAFWIHPFVGGFGHALLPVGTQAPVV